MKPVAYAIALNVQLEPQPESKFVMIRTDEPGHLPVYGSCAKALAKTAGDNGAETISHNYDLNQDNCKEHWVYRVFF